MTVVAWRRLFPHRFITRLWKSTSNRSDLLVHSAIEK